MVIDIVIVIGIGIGIVVVVVVVIVIVIVNVNVIVIVIVTIEGNASRYNDNMYIQNRVLHQYTSSRASFIFQDFVRLELLFGNSF